MKEDVFHLGIKGIIKNPAGKILLLEVNKAILHNAPTSYWDIPGGRIERGSNVLATLKREVEEETGIKKILSIRPLTMVLSNIRIPKQLASDEDVGLILSAYICEVGDIDDIKLSKEHINYGWFDKLKASKLLVHKYPKEFTEKIKEL